MRRQTGNAETVPLLEYDNFYWKQDPEMFAALYRLVREHPVGFGRIVNSSKCDRRLSRWVNTVVAKLDDPAYKTATRIAWIMTGQTDFGKCANPKCGGPVGVGMNFSLSKPRRQYCCRECQRTSPLVNARKRAAMLGHAVGDPSYFDRLELRKKRTKRGKGLPENWCNGDRISETFRRRAEADPDFWKKREAKSRRTKARKGLPPTWRNAGKARGTRMARNGGKFESDESRARRRRTNRLRYGYDSHNSSPVVKRNKRLSCLAKYGVDSPMKLDSVKARLGDSVEERYGVRHVMQAKSVQRKARRKYRYRGRYYSSADEIYFTVYHEERGHAVTYQPDIAFTYEFEGETHVYHPDFALDGEIVELKGDQFFREDGTMFCPYRDRRWSDADYERRCALEEAKRRCMLANGVRVIRTMSDEMRGIRNQVDADHGRGYVAGFRRGVNNGYEERNPEAEGPSREDKA